MLEQAGVTVLENQKLSVTREGERITQVGAEDSGFQEDYLFGDAAGVVSATVHSLQNESDGCTILLSHRPELIRCLCGFRNRSGVQRSCSRWTVPSAHHWQLVCPEPGILPEV